MYAGAPTARAPVPGAEGERGGPMTRRAPRRRRIPLPDREALREAATRRIEEIARHLWADDTIVERAGRSLRFGSNGARVVHLEGQLRGRYADWEACHHGDVFDLWARVELGLSDAGADFPRVLRSLAEFLGVADEARWPARTMIRRRPPAPNPLNDAKAQADAEAIAMMIRATTPVETSPAMAYLRTRGIDASISEATDLRYLPANALAHAAVSPLYAGTGATPPRWLNHPALLCLARDARGEVTGVQRILLGPDGDTRAEVAVPKPATGRLTGAALHLAALRSCGPGPILLAEGPETALSLWQSTGYETRALLGGFGGTYALPNDRRILVCHDADPPGSPAARARHVFLRNLRGAGHGVELIAPPGNGHPGWDFNDVLQHPDLGARAIRNAVNRAI